VPFVSFSDIFFDSSSFIFYITANGSAMSSCVS
jgi:hypothetical protein